RLTILMHSLIIYYTHLSLTIFQFNNPTTSSFYPLSLTTLFRSSTMLHSKWIVRRVGLSFGCLVALAAAPGCSDDAAATSEASARSEEHTSELQSRENLVCRLLLEKKKHIESKIQEHMMMY